MPLIQARLGAVGGHFLEVGCDARAEVGTPGPEGFLEAAKVVGVTAGDRQLAYGGGWFAAGVVSGKDRGEPDQVGPGGLSWKAQALTCRSRRLPARSLALWIYGRFYRAI